MQQKNFVKGSKQSDKVNWRQKTVKMFNDKIRKDRS